MFTFSHPNVMQLIGLSFDRGMPLIIMPLMSKGTVLGYVREHREGLYISESQDKIEVKSMRVLHQYLTYIMVYRLSQPGRHVLGCATRFQRECHILQLTSLFTETLQPETACKVNLTSLYHVYKIIFAPLLLEGLIEMVS